jgi:hypothetical protein
VSRLSSSVVIALVCAVACALVLAACTGPSSPSTSHASPPAASATPSIVPEDRQANFANMAREFLTSTDYPNMSDGQIALIKRAIETGGISFEDYQSALQNTFDCFEKAGLHYSAPAPSNDRGFPFIAYTYEATKSGDNPVATSCIKKNSDAIETLYQMQPSSLEGVDVKFKAAMPVLVPCLREGGYFADVPDPTIEQVKQELVMALREYGEKGPVGDNAWSPRACANSAGITSF